MTTLQCGQMPLDRCGLEALLLNPKVSSLPLVSILGVRGRRPSGDAEAMSLRESNRGNIWVFCPICRPSNRWDRRSVQDTTLMSGRT